MIGRSTSLARSAATAASLACEAGSRTARPLLSQSRPRALVSSHERDHPRTFASSSAPRATATTPHSTASNPAEEESQRHLEIGTTALEAGNITEAKRAYTRAIEIHETPTAHFNLGVCFYHDKETEKAIEAWKNTLRLSPDASDAHTNLASAYVMSSPSRPDLAIEHLKSAASISPQDPEVQFNLGAVLEACEQLEEALRAYERAQEGGIERAKENIRNVNSKIFAVKLGPKPEGMEETDRRENQS